MPDAIIYPTGGGTGIVGMWKAFAELEALGLIGSKRPKHDRRAGRGLRADRARVRRQASATPPLWENAHTVAPGMRVPVAIGDYLILDAVAASGGTAVAVTDADLLAMSRRVSAGEGMYVSPEVGAAAQAAAQLRESGFLRESDEVVVFATGSGLLHTDLIEDGYPTLDPGDADLAAKIDSAYA